MARVRSPGDDRTGRPCRSQAGSHLQVAGAGSVPPDVTTTTCPVRSSTATALGPMPTRMVRGRAPPRPSSTPTRPELARVPAWVGAPPMVTTRRPAPLSTAALPRRPPTLSMRSARPLRLSSTPTIPSLRATTNARPCRASTTTARGGNLGAFRPTTTRWSRRLVLASSMLTPAPSTTNTRPACSSTTGRWGRRRRAATWCAGAVRSRHRAC